jgi:hypothetical protein
MIILKFMFVFSDLLLTVLAVPMRMRKIPPNGWYGSRVKKTMENHDIWYPVNAYSGKWLLAVGLVQAMTPIGFLIEGCRLRTGNTFLPGGERFGPTGEQGFTGVVTLFDPHAGGVHAREEVHALAVAQLSDNRWEFDLLLFKRSLDRGLILRKG